MKIDSVLEWLETNKLSILKEFINAAHDAEYFPTYASLFKHELKEVMEREYFGLYSYMKSDQAGLKKATEDHKRQARTYLAGLTMDEHLQFLQRRLLILETMIARDPAVKEFKDYFMQRLESAKRYYKTMSLTIDTSQKLSQYLAAY